MSRNADWIDPAPKYIRAGESNTVGCDCTGWLGTATISSVSNTDADGLTVASVDRNASTFANDQGGTCAQYHGFTALVSGQASGTEYDTRFAITLSDGQVKVVALTLIGVA
jgi:hypothetical protein